MKFLDLLAVVLCFLLAATIVAYSIPSLTLEQFLTMRVKVSNFLVMAAFMVVWHYIMTAFGLYQSRRLSSFQSEAVDILKLDSQVFRT